MTTLARLEYSTYLGDTCDGVDRLSRDLARVSLLLPPLFKKAFYSRMRESASEGVRYYWDRCNIANRVLNDSVLKYGYQSDEQLAEMGKDKAIMVFNGFCEAKNDEQKLIFFAYELRREGVKTNLTTPEGLLERAICKDFWTRKFKRRQDLAIESLAQDFGMVGEGRELYVSNSSFMAVKDRQHSNTELLSKITATNELGDEFTLKELSDIGVSNPRIRRAEMMTRVGYQGFEKLAQDWGHEWAFWTLTCPSKMHRKIRLKHGQSTNNLKHDGTTPKAAQRYLCQLWSKVRAKFKRQAIEVYGFRIAEPHQDGTPHWHILVFEEGKKLKQATEIMRDYAMRVDGTEAGAEIARFKVTYGNGQGSPAGYIAKYITKSIPTEGDNFDLFGDPDWQNKGKRAEAWARIWGIRQFQQIGGAPVGLWRELRRLKANSKMVKKHELLRAFFQSADEGRWSDFVKLYRQHGLKPLKEAFTNRYEEKTEKVIGIIGEFGKIITRIHRWVIDFALGKKERKQKGQWQNWLDAFDKTLSKLSTGRGLILRV